MNIFALDFDPIVAATMAYDTHTVGMCKESMQMLCTNARIIGFEHPVMCESAYPMHPVTIWARTSSHNMAWQIAHAGELFKQYTKRYGKRHKYNDMYDTLIPIFDKCMDELESQGKTDMTPFALAMPDECKMSCPVASYRKYYAHKAKQECDKLAVYNVLVKRGRNPRRPALRFVWQRGERPTWATYETAQHTK